MSSYIIIYHQISSYIIIYHHISSYIIIYHHISSYIIIYHHISSYIIIYHHISSYMTIRSLHYVMDCFPHGFRQKWLQSQVLEFWAGPWKTPLCCRVLWGPWAEHQGIRLHKWGNIWKLLIYTYNIIMYMGCNMCVSAFFLTNVFFLGSKMGVYSPISSNLWENDDLWWSTISNPKAVLSMKRSPIAGMMLLKGQTLECLELLVQLPRFEWCSGNFTCSSSFLERS